MIVPADWQLSFRIRSLLDLFSVGFERRTPGLKISNVSLHELYNSHSSHFAQPPRLLLLNEETEFM
jgi:hypothetical protein